MDAKIFMNRINVSDFQASYSLEQTIKLDFYDDILVKRYGGCTLINEAYHYSYEKTDRVVLYSNNDIKLILPYSVGTGCFNYLITILKLLRLDYKFNVGYGAWMDGDNTFNEVADIIEFSLPYNDIMVEKLRVITGYMQTMINDDVQKSFAYYVNDSLIIVD